MRFKSKEENNLFIEHWKKQEAPFISWLDDIEDYKRDGYKFIYYISDGTYVKIGIATNPVSRFSAIQSSNPRELTVLKLIPTQYAEKDEKYFHKSFDKYRVRGEWFVLSSEILSHVVTNDLTPNMHLGFVDALISSQPEEEKKGLMQTVRHWIEELNIDPWNIWDMLQRQIHYKNNL